MPTKWSATHGSLPGSAEESRLAPPAAGLASSGQLATTSSEPSPRPPGICSILAPLAAGARPCRAASSYSSLSGSKYFASPVTA